jgi:hypothetical protein
MRFTLTWSVSLKPCTCMTLNNITIVQYLVENINVWGVSKYHDFLWRVGKWPIAGKNWALGINMDLQEGMIIKSVL